MFLGVESRSAVRAGTTGQLGRQSVGLCARQARIVAGSRQSGTAGRTERRAARSAAERYGGQGAAAPRVFLALDSICMCVFAVVAAAASRRQRSSARSKSTAPRFCTLRRLR